MAARDHALEAGQCFPCSSVKMVSLRPGQSAGAEDSNQVRVWSDGGDVVGEALLLDPVLENVDDGVFWWERVQRVSQSKEAYARRSRLGTR